WSRPETWHPMTISVFTMRRMRSSAMLASLCCSVWTTNGKSVSPRRRSKSNSATRSSVGRSQNSKVRATRPTRMYSSIRPSAARISSVGGCVVEARGLSSMRSRASSSVTVWPRRAAASAATLPTGPAPTTRMFRRCMDRGDYTEPVIEPCRLGAKEAAARIERGELSARSLIESCFERIAAREPEVQAWAFANKEVVLSQLNHIEKTGRLRGVPVGVKDIFDTYDMPTEYGSRIYAGHRPRADSAPVALTRPAGRVILGKTVTCEFAPL